MPEVSRHFSPRVEFLCLKNCKQISDIVACSLVELRFSSPITQFRQHGLTNVYFHTPEYTEHLEKLCTIIELGSKHVQICQREILSLKNTNLKCYKITNGQLSHLLNMHYIISLSKQAAKNYMFFLPGSNVRYISSRTVDFLQVFILHNYRRWTK